MSSQPFPVTLAEQIVGLEEAIGAQERWLQYLTAQAFGRRDEAVRLERLRAALRTLRALQIAATQTTPPASPSAADVAAAVRKSLMKGVSA